MADVILYHRSGVSKGVPAVDASYWEGQGWSRTPIKNTPVDQSPAAQKEIVKSGSRLYAFDGTNYSYIPDQNALSNFVTKQGYKDTRREVSIPGIAPSSSAPAILAAPPAQNVVTKEIVKAGGRLYAFDGTNYSYIPDQNALQTLVIQQGYKDTRREVPMPGQTPTVSEKKQDFSVVKFADSPAVYLVDHDTHNLQPFLNEAAFNNTFKESANEAWNSIETITEDNFQQGGTLAGFQVLGTSYGVREDGSIPEVPGPSPAAISNRYGKDNNEDTNWTAYLAVDGFLDLLRSAPDVGISASTIDAIKNDMNQVSMLMNAVAYGGYSLEDIYKEVKRKDLVAKGDKSFEGSSVISSDKMKDDFMAGDGSSILSNPRLAMPSSMGGLVSNPELYRLKLYQMPPELFKELVPTLDVTSEAFQEEASQIKDIYHDILMQNFNAQTDQEKAIADDNYRLFKEQVEKKYGVALSANAINAWDQIQNIFTTLGERGLTDTGIGHEEVSSYLKKVRAEDAKLREANLTEAESEERNFYLQSASAKEIKDLVSSDPEKAKRWGIIPSEETSQKLSVENLMKEYGVTQKQAEDYRSWIVDENGNYRSNLFQKLKSDLVQQEGDKHQFQVEQLLGKNLQKEEHAYAQVSEADNPYSSYIPPGSDLPSVLEKTKQASETSKLDTSSLEKSGSSAQTYKYVANAPQGWTTDPKTGKLMKIPDNYVLDASKKTYIQSTTPSGADQKIEIKSFAPPSGYDYIPNVELMKNYTDIIKDTTPGSKKLYGKKII